MSDIKRDPSAEPTFREKIRNGESVIGLFQCVPSFQISEILSHGPLDYITIEAEHAATSLTSMHAQVAAIADRKPVMVRLISGAPDIIKPVLDLGVTGIMIPNVSTAEQARAIVAQTRFAPEGERGIGGSVRCSRFGANPSYFKDGPLEPVIVILQIEDQQGLDNISEISAVDGVDAVFIGPMDLSSQLGHRGNPGAPEVHEAIVEGLRKVKEVGGVTGILCAPDKVKEWQSLGVSVFLIGSEIGALNNSISEMLKRCV